MDTLDACFVIPEVSLFLKAIANTSSCIELTPWPADEAATCILTVEIAFLALIASAVIVELLVLRADTVELLAIEDLLSTALDLIAFASALVISTTRLAFNTSVAS